MKIVFLCPSFYPSVGGVERHSQEVAERLIAKGHEVIVLCEGMEGVSYIENIRVEHMYFGPPGVLKKFTIWMRMLQKLPAFLFADVIHIHDVVFWYYPLSLLLFFKPVYATFHGYEGIVPPTRKAILLRKVSALLSKKTIEVGSYIQKWYGTHPTKIVHGGATYIITNPPEKKKQERPLRFAFIGRLSQDIGIQKYIEFFLMLKKNRIPFSLEIYGEGPLKKKLQVFGKYKGVVAETMKPILKADVVCASSYLSMIDALSLGKPVIAFYDNPLKKEYLEEFPMIQYIAHGDRVDKVYEAFIEIWKEFDAKKVSIEAQGTFSWDSITKDYLALWRK